MSAAYGDIARILAGARRREGRLVLLTAGGFGAAGGLLALLFGALALTRGWGGPSGGRQLSLALLALSLVGAATWAALALLRRAGTPQATARSLAGPDLGLHSDLVSAVELTEAREGLAAAGYSVALADAHVVRAAGRALAIDLARALPPTPARRAGLVLGAAAALNLLALALGGRGLAAGYARLAGLGPPPPVAQADPITGDVELTFLYPAHTGRSSTTVSGTGGEITAPRGTEVRLSARADRTVDEADLLVESAEAAAAAPPAAPGKGDPPPGKPGAAPGERSGPPPGPQTIALAVQDRRQLSGRLTVDQPGSYRFRFRKGRKVLALGPPIAIAVEPDAFPEVRITAPTQAESEVDGKARLRVDWTASDDYGLKELALLTRTPGGQEERRVLRAFDGARRESGSLELDVAAFRLGEGEKLLYWLEVLDNDAVSGPKRGASATQAVKVYSAAEHRRKLLAEAQVLWEKMVALLADRLELRDGLTRWTAPLLARGQAADARTKALHESLRDTARAMRKEKDGPRSIPDALANVAGGLRALEAPLSSARAAGVRLLALAPPGDGIWARLQELDGALDRELEKDVLYLEQLFDKERALDLVQLAKELQAKRRDLASLLERYRQAPSEDARRQLLAEIARMKQRMNEMMRRMAELAKGIQDEHMNAEAMAEAAQQQEAMAGLDQVEEALRRGDVDAAMKALDAMGSRMQDMLSRLERTAGMPDQKNRELVKEMREFQKRLEEVEKRQQELAGETEKVRQAYRKKLGERMQKLADKAARMEQLARESRQELQSAGDGLTPRAEEEFGRSQEAMQDLEKALSVKDFEAALESVKKAVPSMQRLGVGLEDEAQLAERFPQPPGAKGPMVLRDAGRHVSRAQQPARKIQEELEKLFPDPRTVLSPGDQRKLEGLSKQQGEVERQAGQLRQKLAELAEKAPVFPPQAQGQLGEVQGHMAQAQGELSQKNPQRGHGEQRQALDGLARFRQGLEEMARRQGGKGGGEGFPFPMALGGSEGQEGDDGEMSREKVEIPGADAYKVPEEFRKDILEAMKQGAPEPYRPELQRYYQELVK